MFQDREVVRQPGIEFNADQAAERFMPGAIVVFPAFVRAVFFVGIDKDIVAFIQTTIFCGLWIHLDLAVGHTGCPFVFAVRVAKIVAPDPVPVDGRPGRVCCVPALGRGAEEVVTLLPQRVHCVLRFAPGHFDVAHMPQIRVNGIQRNAVISRSNERTGRDDHVGQVRRGLDTFAVHDQILTVLDRFRNVAVTVQSAAVCIERNRIVDLFPERHTGIRAVQHQSLARLAPVLPGDHPVDLVGAILAARCG